MTPLDPSKPAFLSKLDTFGHGKTSGDMVGRCMPNSGHGGCPGTRVMTIFGPMLPPNVQIRIDEIFLTWPSGHLQA